MKFLTDEQLSRLLPAETSSFPAPVPTQIVSSDEYVPLPHTEQQREVEARLKEMSDGLARRQGLSRRRFFQTASGMAASFVAINEVFGHIFDATPAEAATPEMANERAKSLSKQLVIDDQTHFLRDDTRLTLFVKLREEVGRWGWNPELSGKPQTLADLKFNNYFKEIYLDSDTKIALLSNSPSDIARDWFLSNDEVFKTRKKVNAHFRSRRMLAHYTITPGRPGWLEEIDKAVEVYKPDSWKGYTVGDNTHKESSHWPYHLDDEKLMYPFYEKAAKAGVVNICIHKGLFAPAVAKEYPRLRPYADVRDVGKAAKDWPQLNFIIYHSGYRWVGGNPADAMAEFDRTGRSAWASDLAEIPEKYGVHNVYGDLGQVVAWTTVAQPRLFAALMGLLVKGLGHDRIVWGTDAVWTGAPQWQIEGLRRLEIPQDMQKKYGFAPLGPAEGPTKTAIFSGNAERLYGLKQQAELLPHDGLAAWKAEYDRDGPGRSNLRYGYVAKPA